MTRYAVILVTGATGTVGRQVVPQLLDRGAAVRALIRDPEAADLPDAVEVVRGDLSVPGSLGAALDGVESVFLLFPTLAADDAAPETVEAIAKHARRIVYLSARGVPDDPEQASNPIPGADIPRMGDRPRRRLPPPLASYAGWLIG